MELIRKYDAVLVEDNPYSELRFDGEPLPHLFDLDDSEGRVLHVGTFSKTIAPGLRVGWVVASQEVIEKLVLAKQAVDLHTSTLCQHIVYEMIRGGLLEQRLPQLCRAYRQRRDAMLAALAKRFPAQASWTRPDGGMFLMLQVPDVDAAELLKLALQQGVVFVPGEEFHLRGGGRNTLRLNFSNSSPALIEEGVKRLSAALQQLELRSGSGVPLTCG
jgi:2-aminoadipate transaminase